MNRNEWRASRKQNRRALHEFGAEAGQAIDIFMVRSEQVVCVLDAWLNGDCLSGLWPATVQAIGHWMSTVEAGGRPLCLFCEHEWRERREQAEPLGAFIFLKPGLNDLPERVVVSAVCGECSRRSDAEIMERACAKVVAMNPGFRAVRHHEMPEAQQ